MGTRSDVFSERPELLALIADVARIDDDAAQDAAIELLRLSPEKIREFDSKDALLLSLFRSARKRNRRSDTRRKIREVVRCVNADDVLELVATLPEDDRFLVLWTARGIPRKEIAKCLGIGIGAVDARLSTLRDKIREMTLGQFRNGRVRFDLSRRDVARS